MKRIDYACLIGLLFAILAASFTGFASDCEALRNEVLRLHILANSDSDEDQTLKYRVRDRILEECGGLLSGEELSLTEESSRELLPELERVARETVLSCGYDYEASAELVNMYFGTRVYGDVMVAAGRYDAVRVVLGEGEGQNWWCVMFPPICLPAAAATEAGEPVREQIEELGRPEYIPKFAVVELIENVREKLRGED